MNYFEEAFKNELEKTAIPIMKTLVAIREPIEIAGAIAGLYGLYRTLSQEKKKEKQKSKKIPLFLAK